MVLLQGNAVSARRLKTRLDYTRGISELQANERDGRSKPLIGRRSSAAAFAVLLLLFFGGRNHVIEAANIVLARCLRNFLSLAPVVTLMMCSR
jgi:hypothetical protein